MCRSPEWRHDTPEGYNITKIQFFRWQNSQNFKRILKMLSKNSQSSQNLVPGGYSLKPQPKNRIFQMPKQFKNTLFPFFRQKHRFTGMRRVPDCWNSFGNSAGCSVTVWAYFFYPLLCFFAQILLLHQTFQQKYNFSFLGTPNGPVWGS